ncbi:DUF4232 domain-containing protein [Streptomyces sp. URMC 126]|uniref:DUF4232 domain-containing protein n=1 Tax=Streptomyces sp. URMC 126 TaxID=3423401 RepID=UPI003F1ADED2
MNRTMRNHPFALLLILSSAAALTACGRSDPVPSVRAQSLPTAGVPTAPARPSPSDFVLTGPTRRPPSGAAPSAEQPSRSTPAACPPEGLRVTAESVEGAMGLRSMTVRLDNCGARPRTVEGHPRVRVLGERGRVLDVTVHDDLTAVAASGVPNTPSRPVTLRPGAAAVAVVLWRNTLELGRTPQLGRHLEVTPAPGHRAQAVEPEGGVDLGSTGKLAVDAWRPVS